MIKRELIAFIGIDPGFTGGIAIIIRDEVALFPMPVIKSKNKRFFDEQRIKLILDSQATIDYGYTYHVFIELVQAHPKQGVVSMFNFGAGWGLVRGICAGLGLSYELVRPQEWKKVMMKGQPKGSEYLVASRLWPRVNWLATERSRKPHSGVVDAALIAEYGRRIFDRHKE